MLEQARRTTRPLRRRLHAEGGQALFIVVAALFVTLGMAALAIDLSAWYQKHHQAQLAADAAALAAANCMSSGACTSTLVGTTTAATYASTNSLPSPTVTINPSADNVTVTTAGTAPVSFAGLFKLQPSVQAVAVASWVKGSTPYSLFAGNTSCGSGTGIYFQGQGGGSSYVPGIHTNGLLTVNSNSGSTAITGSVTYNAAGSGPYCSGTAADNTKNVAYVSSGDAGGSPNGTLPWPEVYYQPTTTAPATCSYTVCPTCNHIGSYFTTNSGAPPGNQVVSGGGVYCVTSPFSSTCNYAVDGVTGSIYVNAKVTGVELVAPCVSIGSGANGSSAITGDSAFEYPFVFGTGTSNPVVGTGNGNTTNGSAANPTVFIGDSNKGQSITITGTIYAPGACSTSASWDPNQTCSGTINGGTVEFSGNNQMTGFVEAENIWIDKNNFGTLTGNGPTNPYGGTALVQ